MMATYVAPVLSVDGVSIQSPNNILSLKALQAKVASGSSASGVAGTLVADLTATAGKVFQDWIVLVRNGSGGASGVDIIITFTDDTTETFTSVAANATHVATVAGVSRMDLSSAMTIWAATAAKQVKKIHVQTAGAGAVTREAAISAYELTP
jgi:hypothetical protein